MRAPRSSCFWHFRAFLPPFGASLKKVGAIDLPGPKGQRFDYLTVDEEHQYLACPRISARAFSM